MSIGEMMRDKFDCRYMCRSEPPSLKLACPGFATPRARIEKRNSKKGILPIATRQIRNGTDHHYE